MSGDAGGWGERAPHLSCARAWWGAIPHAAGYSRPNSRNGKRLSHGTAPHAGQWARGAGHTRGTVQSVTRAMTPLTAVAKCSPHTLEV